MNTPDSTDTDRLAEIAARLDAATTWPWHVTEFDDDHAMSLIAVATTADTDDSSEIIAATLVQAPRYVDIADDRWQENADLIANAPSDLAHLLSLVEQLQRQVESDRKDVALLMALEAGGVDNWIGYEDAVQAAEETTR